MSVSSVKSAVRGRENEVLTAIGITPNKDANQHITCPYTAHGGKNDWRWDAKKARAFCSCISAGSHSIFDVVMEVRGCQFIESVDIIAGILGVENEQRKFYPSGKAASLLKPPANVASPDLPSLYLEHRLGQDPVMPSSKTAGWREFPYYEGGKESVGEWPCAVFQTISGDGRNHAHRIYVAAGGAGKANLGKNRDPKKSATKTHPDENTSGCSVTWGDPTTAPAIIVCEGIETGGAIAVAVKKALEAGKVAVAAAISTSGIRGFVPWAANGLIVVAADRDENKPKDHRGYRAGEKAARSLCKKYHETHETEICLPGKPGEGIDYLDMLLRDGADEVLDSINGGDPFLPSEDDEDVQESKAVINIEAGRVDIRVSECERVLGENGAVYQRGAYLTRVARVSDPASSMDIKRASGSLIMMVVDAPFLQAELCKVADFKRWSGKQEDWVSADPMIGDIRALMSGAGHWPTIPAITGITEVPVIANDGRVIDTPGHDEATGIYFDPGGTSFPKIKENPTRDDALKALKTLKDLVAGFPFVDGIAESVAISQILTPFKRPFLRSAPMFLNTAPKMGSGKTLLATVVSYIATGTPPASMSQEENRDEEKKRMLALLMAGSAVTVIDNIEKPLKSDTLCTVLTEPVWKERILGKSEEIKVGTATTWIATGNNLEVSGDLSTRSLVCTIDPECERPEERNFKINLHEHVPARRGEFSAACLTIIRAYWLAKKRGEGVEGAVTFGRFEQWSEWVRESLMWLGMADPCQARKLVEARDSVREELGMVLDAWYDMFGDVPQTLNAALGCLKDAVTEGEIALRDALEPLCANHKGDLLTRKLGKYVSQNENRIESGLKFVRAGSDKRAVKWAVLQAVGSENSLGCFKNGNETSKKVSLRDKQVIDNKEEVSFRELAPLSRVRNQKDTIVSNSVPESVEGGKHSNTHKHTNIKERPQF